VEPTQVGKIGVGPQPDIDIIEINHAKRAKTGLGCHFSQGKKWQLRIIRSILRTATHTHHWVCAKRTHRSWYMHYFFVDNQLFQM